MTSRVLPRTVGALVAGTGDGARARVIGPLQVADGKPLLVPLTVSAGDVRSLLEDAAKRGR